MATKQITLSTICPREDHRREICARCIKERLGARPGIRQIVMRPDNGDATAVLELDYDPRLLSLAEVDAELKSAGACLAPDHARLVLAIDGMVSHRSEQAIESVLNRLPGVTASASYVSRTVRVEFDRRQCALPEIARRLDAIGMRIRQGGARPPHVHGVPDKQPALRTSLTRAADLLRRVPSLALGYHELAMAIVGGLMLLAGFLVHVLGPAELNWLRLTLLAGAYLLCGWYTFLETIQTLREFRFDIDVLMFAAAFGAASLGRFEEGALLLFLFALGGAGEELAMDRARKAIEALAKLAPETGTVRAADGTERMVRVEEIQVGDIVVVRPSDRIPADGVVIDGASAVDQSAITGESVPVEKVVESPVFAGTINGDGLLLVKVTRLAGESTLAKIVRMVQEAQTTKSPTQVFTNRVEKWYVPFVLLGTAMLIVLPPVLLDGSWAIWFYRSMAFLTAASPCALAIGTPATVLCGIARAARMGVLIKGGVHLENMGRLKVIAFDKTGTLTRGRASVCDIVPLDGRDERELLSHAAAVEAGSAHPLALAIVGEARSRDVIRRVAQQVEQIQGQGIRATVDGRRVVVGKPSLVASLDEDASSRIKAFQEQGKTAIVVGINDRPAGIITLADQAREGLAETLQRLQRLGISRTIMLTGDNQQVAARIARDMGIHEYHAELMPQEKLELVSRLQREHGHIAMVGDGVNDAPAMAAASVGIAMGAGGTDVAIETADVALMADDLSKLPDAIALSRFTRRLIKQNLLIALGTIALLAPSAAIGLAPLGLAVLFHEGSTVVVVLNAMRLLVFKPR